MEYLETLIGELSWGYYYLVELGLFSQHTSLCDERLDKMTILPNHRRCVVWIRLWNGSSYPILFICFVSQFSSGFVIIGEYCRDHYQHPHFVCNVSCFL